MLSREQFGKLLWGSTGRSGGRYRHLGGDGRTSPSLTWKVRVQERFIDVSKSKVLRCLGQDPEQAWTTRGMSHMGDRGEILQGGFQSL